MLSLPAPNVALTFGLSLTRSPLSYPVPPRLLSAPAPCGGTVPLASPETDSSAWLPTEGRQRGRGEEPSARAPPHLFKQLMKTIDNFYIIFESLKMICKNSLSS